MRATERLCVHCETPFLARNANAHLCSDPCRAEVRKENARNRHRERKIDKKVRHVVTKKLRGRGVPEEEVERNNFLFILLDVPSKQLTQFEQGVVWALTQIDET